jgi:hypothetical protein
MADHCSIVPHVTEPRVLVAAEGSYWTLPHHETEDAEAIRALMRQRYGLDVTVLGAYAGHYDADDVERDEPVFIFALETHGSTDTLPDGARWINHYDLADMLLADAEQRQTLERWFAEAESDAIPAARAPWERPGWFALATQWIERQVAKRDWQPTGPLVVIGAAAADIGW